MKVKVVSKQSLFMFDHETFPEWTGFNVYYLAIFKVGSHFIVCQVNNDVCKSFNTPEDNL